MILIALADLENPALNLYQYIEEVSRMNFLKYRSKSCLFSGSSFHCSMSLSISLLTFHVRKVLWSCRAFCNLWRCKAFSYLKIFTVFPPFHWDVSSPLLALLRLLFILVSISSKVSLVSGEVGWSSGSLASAPSSHPHHSTQHIGLSLYGCLSLNSLLLSLSLRARTSTFFLLQYLAKCVCHKIRVQCTFPMG